MVRNKKMIQQQPLKTTVLKADRKAAEAVTANLLSVTYASGKAVCQRVETSTGWQVNAPMLTAEGTKARCVVLEYIDDNGRISVKYDERVVTI
jgi:hypothetical protein